MDTEPKSTATEHGTNEKRTALWSGGHGRSPTLEMRHTVDDKLQVATHTPFLPFRALLHRNNDKMVLYSEEVIETKLRPNSQQHTKVSRSFVVTDRHVYMMSMPAAGFFAGSSNGGCFALSEFSRMCTVEGTGNCILQFVNGVIALQLNGVKDMQRLVDVMFSVTGVRADLITKEADDAVKASQAHFSRDTKKFVAVSAAPSVAASSIGAKSRTTNKSLVSVGSEVTSAAGTIDNVLRQILEGNNAGDVSKLFPEVGCQTEERPVSHANVGTHSHSFEDRSCSPIVMFQTLMHSRGGGPMDGGVGREDSERSGSTATNSEFDVGEVWKSLKRSTTALSSFSNQAASQRNMTQRNHSPSPAAMAAGGRQSSPHQSSKLTAQRFQQPPAAAKDIMEGDASPSTPTSHNATRQRGKDDPKGEIQGAAPKEGDGTEAKGDGTEALDSFLGVLSLYSPQLIKCGCGSVAKLMKLSEEEIDDIMDKAGIVKQGHRMLLFSKLAVAKQQAAKAKK